MPAAHWRLALPRDRDDALRRGAEPETPALVAALEGNQLLVASEMLEADGLRATAERPACLRVSLESIAMTPAVLQPKPDAAPSP